MPASGGGESKKQLGKILLQQKLVSPDDLQEMLDEQKRDPGARLASTAARRGRIAVADALRALGEQHGVPPVDLAEVVIPLSILRLIPVELAREHALLPFRVEGERLLLAMSSPDRREALEEIEFVAAKKIVIYVALDYAVRHVIDHAYARLEAGDDYYVGAHVTDDALAVLGLPPTLSRAPEPLGERVTEGADEAAAPAAPASAPAAAQDGVAAPVAALAATAVAAPAAPAPAQPSPDTSASASASANANATPAAATTASGGSSPPPAELDAAFSARVRPSQRPVLHTPAADARALIALRDGSLRSRLASLLTEQGVVCSDTADGIAALERVRAESPRVCVLDPELSSVQGLDICRRLRASTRYATLPIVLVVDGAPSWRFVHDVRQSFGVEHVFGKPYELPALVQTIRLLLEGQVVPEDPPPLGAIAEAHWSAGMKAFENGALPEAIAALEAGLAIEPRAFELLYHLGLLYGRRDDLFSALRVLEQAATVQPRNFAVIKNLAVVYQRAGMVQSAIDAWQRARTCSPDEATAASIREHLFGLL
jgi:DNA-binding response OmpR family regulator